MFEWLAAKDGSAGRVWGPCSDGSKLECDCPQCQHANRLEEEGKDWDIEYEKARKEGFRTVDT